MTDKQAIIPEADEQQDGAFMRGFKAAKRQGVCDYDRGVIAGLCQAREICSDREDMLAERIAREIQDAIESTGRASGQVAHSATNQRKLVPLVEHNKLTAGPASWADQRVPTDVFQAARGVFGTSSHEDDKRVYRTLQSAFHKLTAKDFRHASVVEMVYLLKLVPRGDTVPIQILDVVSSQFDAALAAVFGVRDA